MAARRGASARSPTLIPRRGLCRRAAEQWCQPQGAEAERRGAGRRDPARHELRDGRRPRQGDLPRDRRERTAARHHPGIRLGRLDRSRRGLGGRRGAYRLGRPSARRWSRYGADAATGPGSVRALIDGLLITGQRDGAPPGHWCRPRTRSGSGRRSGRLPGDPLVCPAVLSKAAGEWRPSSSARGARWTSSATRSPTRPRAASGWPRSPRLT
jgi:hypothetical protein